MRSTVGLSALIGDRLDTGLEEQVYFVVTELLVGFSSRDFRNRSFVFFDFNDRIHLLFKPPEINESG